MLLNVSIGNVAGGHLGRLQEGPADFDRLNCAKTTSFFSSSHSGRLSTKSTDELLENLAIAYAPLCVSVVHSLRFLFRCLLTLF